MGVARGEESENPNFSHFCVRNRCFWRAAPQVNEEFLAPHSAIGRSLHQGTLSTSHTDLSSALLFLSHTLIASARS